MVLFGYGMSDDFLLIITDAPENALIDYCRWHVKGMENGGNFDLFAPLKRKYHVKLLLDSEVDDREDLEILIEGKKVYCFDFSNYENEEKSQVWTTDQVQKIERLSVWYKNKIDKVLKGLENGKIHIETYWDDVKYLTKSVRSDRQLREWQIVLEGVENILFNRCGE